MLREPFTITLDDGLFARSRALADPGVLDIDLIHQAFSRRVKAATSSGELGEAMPDVIGLWGHRDES